MQSFNELPWRAVLTSLACVVLAGCVTRPPATRPFNISVTVDAVLAASSLQIDLIGVNASDLPKWRSLSVSEYWQPGDPKRRDAEKAVLDFRQGKKLVQVFPAIDPLWNRWFATGAEHLVVLVNLTGLVTDREGDADPRRLILPLEKRAWNSAATTIELRVQESSIRLLTPRKSVK
jgi:hypothetical protein